MCVFELFLNSKVENKGAAWLLIEENDDFEVDHILGVCW